MDNGNASYDKLLTMWRDEKKKVEELKKNIELVREDGQAEIMRRDQRISQLEKIEREHQDLNGQLRLEITRLKGGLWYLNQVLKLKEKEHKQ